MRRPFKSLIDIINRHEIDLNESGLSKRMEEFFTGILEKDPKKRRSIISSLAFLEVTTYKLDYFFGENAVFFSEF